MARRSLSGIAASGITALALMAAGRVWAQLPGDLPPPPPEPKKVYAEPPEEDKGLATPTTYTFNPLQAQKEISVGDFNMKQGNTKGAAMRYREATLWDDGNVEGFYKWGEASEKLKDYASARGAFTKFLALSKDEKKAAEVKKRMAKYPPDAGPTEAAKQDKPQSLDQVLQEERQLDGDLRGKGVWRK